MSSTAPTLDEADTAWERALLDEQLERLNRLADMGLALAGEIQRRATTAAPDADISHAAIDFARASRAVRMTLALQSKLVRDFKTPIKAGPARSDDDDDEDVQWEVKWLTSKPTVDEQKANVRRAMREAAKDAGLDAGTVERLDGEARERMERDDIYADILSKPFDELVARICEDLGLATSAPSPVHGREGISAQDGAAETVERRNALSTTSGDPPLPPAQEVASP
jgi:hypothetical protein